MESQLTEHGIRGWGSDLPKEVRPAVPMWEKPEKGTGAHWEELEFQPVNIEVLHSIERPRMTAVFGTSVPPRGLSGVFRRQAFKYGEGSFGHWIPLLIADRINVVEGIIEDLLSGKIPNIFTEMGGKAEWKYNRKGFYKKIAIFSLFTVLAVSFISLMSRSKSQENS